MGYIFDKDTNIRIYYVDSETTVVVKSTKPQISITYKIKDGEVMGLVVAEQKLDKNMKMYKQFAKRLMEYVDYSIKKALEKRENPFYIDEV